MECQICLREVDELDKSLVHCQHCNATFHGEELSQWILNHTGCPSCKLPFDPYDIFELTDRYDLEIDGKTEKNLAAWHYYSKETSSSLIVIPLLLAALVIIILGSIVFTY